MPHHRLPAMAERVRRVVVRRHVGMVHVRVDSASGGPVGLCSARAGLTRGGVAWEVEDWRTCLDEVRLIA